MGSQRGRELKRRPGVGYVCEECGEVFALVVVDPELRGEVEVPQEVGCPECPGDLTPVLIWNVGGRSVWLPRSRGASFRKGRVMP